MQHEPSIALPRTVADALKLWDAGEPVPAFRVESEGATQDAIWRAAFEMGAFQLDQLLPDTDASKTLSVREINIAVELLIAMNGHGYAKMVQINLAGGGEPIFVQSVQRSRVAVTDEANPGTLT